MAESNPNPADASEEPKRNRFNPFTLPLDQQLGMAGKLPTAANSQERDQKTDDRAALEKLDHDVIRLLVLAKDVAKVREMLDEGVGDKMCEDSFKQLSSLVKMLDNMEGFPKITTADFDTFVENMDEWLVRRSIVEGETEDDIARARETYDRLQKKGYLNSTNDVIAEIEQEKLEKQEKYRKDFESGNLTGDAAQGD